jgi:hypothetical protein
VIRPAHPNRSLSLGIAKVGRLFAFLGRSAVLVIAERDDER